MINMINFKPLLVTAAVILMNGIDIEEVKHLGEGQGNRSVKEIRGMENVTIAKWKR